MKAANADKAETQLHGLDSSDMHLRTLKISLLFLLYVTTVFCGLHFQMSVLVMNYNSLVAQEQLAHHLTDHDCDQSLPCRCRCLINVPVLRNTFKNIPVYTSHSSNGLSQKMIEQELEKVRRNSDVCLLSAKAFKCLRSASNSI